MKDLVIAISDTWTVATIVVAVAAGLGVGYLMLGKLASNPAYASQYLTSRSVGILVIVTALFSGGAFYIGQIVATAAEGDGGWARILSRYGLWIIYSIALGIGTSFRLDKYSKRRMKKIYESVKHDIELNN